MSSSLMPNYKRLPVSFNQGDGAWIWDTTGKRYLDALAGIAVCGLGHAHPVLRQNLCAQVGELLHTSNLYGIERQSQLADKLTALSGLDQVFFSNSGAEANEAAIKLARLYAHQQNMNNPVIVSMAGSFHGRTLATLTATGNPAVKIGFEPLPAGFVTIPYNDMAALENLATQQNIAAVLVEPIQGEGGINIPAASYLPALRRFCDQHKALLILDEIQTGIARTGKWFAYQQHQNMLPDIMTLAKGLGNGVPIGACVARQAVGELMQPGTHGSTFGGNPLACRAALTVLEVIETENLIERVLALSQRFLAGFSPLLALEQVQAIRIQGLMIGIELSQPCPELVIKALEKGLLINVTAGSVVRLLPPLIISDAQADQMIATVSELIQAFSA